MIRKKFSTGVGISSINIKYEYKIRKGGSLSLTALSVFASEAKQSIYFVIPVQTGIQED